jgi:Xaa-Pro aminopeptidase
MADQVLIFADTERSPELRHELPVGIGDPFLYAETNGTRHVLTNVLERQKLEDLGGLALHFPTDYGVDDLIKEGGKPEEIQQEIILRACRDFGIEDALVPAWFPVDLADFLRGNGLELRPDRDFFNDRRRSKSEHEIAGIRRAQKAAEAGMAAARGLLRAAEGNGTLMLDGEPLTCERIKRAIGQAFTDNDCTADDFIVARGAQAAVGHDTGSGSISAGEVVVIDLWPKDRESACYADMTRTFVVGEPSEEIVEWHRLVKEALDQTLEATEPGVKGRAVFDISCDIFEEAGQKTQRTKEHGKPLDEGFFHGLGHGVGLEVHEAPFMGLLGEKELVPGDVITLEPGLYRQGFGGVRLEDLVLVTEDGAENLTKFPYDLTP